MVRELKGGENRKKASFFAIPQTAYTSSNMTKVFLHIDTEMRTPKSKYYSLKKNKKTSTRAMEKCNQTSIAPSAVILGNLKNVLVLSLFYFVIIHFGTTLNWVALRVS